MRTGPTIGNFLDSIQFTTPDIVLCPVTVFVCGDGTSVLNVLEDNIGSNLYITSIVTPPAHGSATIGADATTILYTPNAK